MFSKRIFCPPSGVFSKVVSGELGGLAEERAELLGESATSKLEHGDECMKLQKEKGEGRGRHGDWALVGYLAWEELTSERAWNAVSPLRAVIDMLSVVVNVAPV